jgi:hypothetical protein
MRTRGTLSNSVTGMRTKATYVKVHEYRTTPYHSSHINIQSVAQGGGLRQYVPEQQCRQVHAPVRRFFSSFISQFKTPTAHDGYIRR